MFRREALDYRQDRLHGDVLEAYLPRLRLLVAVACAIPIVMLVYSVCGQYTRKERVAGYLMPSAGLIKVFTPQAGIVAKSHVAEGRQVQKGDALLVLTSDVATASVADSLAAMQGEIRLRRDSIAQSKRTQEEIDTLASVALARRIEGLEAQLDQARQQVELQSSRVESAGRTLARHKQLVAAGFLSLAALQEKEEALMDQRSQLAALLRAVTGLASDLDTARSEYATTALRNSNNTASMERQISELTQQSTEADARRGIMLTAPAAGTVTTIHAIAGQAASPGAPLLSILPAGAVLEAQLLVPTRAAGFIRPGQSVALRYQAFPYQRFGHFLGEVTEVGRSVIQPNETSLPVSITEPVYRITVRLPSQHVLAYGQSLPLQAGMALDADVWVDRRSILEWLLDPILSVARRA